VRAEQPAAAEHERSLHLSQATCTTRVPLFSEAQRVANRIGLRAVAKGEEPNALGGDGLGLDRVEDGDGLRRCDGPATVDGGTAVLADPERRAAIHRLHHAIVDHTYGVARDGWARALPGLHAAWEQLVEKYPGRARAAPRTQPDGSWVADGNRRLNPEQNSEACKACKDVSDEGKQVILPAMQRIEAADPDRKLAGLEHMLKGEDRLKEKIADYLRAPGVMVREALGMVPDAVRFTLTYSAERYSDGVRADVDRFKAEGFELIKLKNLWSGDQYKGINSQWRRPETGLRFEMQFHTLESLEAKELTHKAYERIRSSASAVERRELEAFQSQVNALIVTPPGTAGIEDFPEKNHG
jgi:hypothetical protein